MGKASYRIEPVEPIGIRGHERYLMQRMHPSPVTIIICQTLEINCERPSKKEQVYRMAKDPYRGNLIDIRL